MNFRADFDDVFPNAIRVDLSKLDWVSRMSGPSQFVIRFAYPVENPPQFGDFVYVCEGDKPIFTGYALDVQDKELTLTNARRSPVERIE